MARKNYFIKNISLTISRKYMDILWNGVSFYQSCANKQQSQKCLRQRKYQDRTIKWQKTSSIPRACQLKDISTAKTEHTFWFLHIEASNSCQVFIHFSQENLLTRYIYFDEFLAWQIWHTAFSALDVSSCRFLFISESKEQLFHSSTFSFLLTWLDLVSCGPLLQQDDI
jgi:hypothetical protein